MTTSDDGLPVSPHYRPLVWTGDESDEDDLEIEADSDDWRYRICSVAEDDGEFLCYQVDGGDIEERCDLGSFDTLQDAKDAAQANYAGRYCEAEHFLLDVVSGAEDDDGHTLTRLDQEERIFCRVDELNGEVEIVATLRDYGDDFDIAERRWTVCLRSILVYLSSGDWIEGLHQNMRGAGVLDSTDSQ